MHFAGKFLVEKMLPVLVLDDRVVHSGHVRCCCFASSDLVEVNIRNPVHVVVRAGRSCRRRENRSCVESFRSCERENGKGAITPHSMVT